MTNYVWYVLMLALAGSTLWILFFLLAPTTWIKTLYSLIFDSFKD